MLYLKPGKAEFIVSVELYLVIYYYFFDPLGRYLINTEVGGK